MKKKSMLSLMIVLPLLLGIVPVSGYPLGSTSWTYNASLANSCSYGWFGSCSQTFYGGTVSASMSFTASDSNIDYFTIQMDFSDSGFSVAGFSQNGYAEVSYAITVTKDGSFYTSFSPVYTTMPSDAVSTYYFTDRNFNVNAGPGTYLVIVTFQMILHVSGGDVFPGSASGSASIDSMDFDINIEATNNAPPVCFWIFGQRICIG